MNVPVVLFANGVLLSILGVLMAVPVLCEFVLTGLFQVSDFLLPMAGCAFVGLALVFANKRPGVAKLETVDAFLLTSLTWLILPFFAGLPFYFCVPAHLTFIDAYFEAVAALTTTGCTMIQSLDDLPRWIILWRFLLAYIGGVGIILMGMLIFPALRIGGMQLFRTESSEKSEKILPSVVQMATWILSVYSGAILVCFLALRFSHLSTLDAACHAISAVSTCGFSTHPDSVAAFHSFRCELILLCGMLFGGTSLLLIIKLIRGQWFLLRKDMQLRGYFKTILFFVILITLLRWVKNDASFLRSLRDGVFYAVSMLTTTGFVNDAYESWGTFTQVLFPVLGLIGSCTGSTSGGIKIFRWQILLSSLKVHIFQLRRPHGIYIPTYDGKEISPTVAMSIFIFVVLFFVLIIIAAIALSFSGLDFQTSFSAAMAALCNLGVGVGNLAGPSGSLVSIAIFPKIILMVCMILGRLEVLTLLTLLVPSFWKK